jgi:hypothetical protein
LLPAPNTHERLAVHGPYERDGASDDADVLLDLAPDHEVGGVLGLVDVVCDPEEHDAEAGGGGDDGEEADGEDGDEFDAAAEFHGFEVEEEDDWECPVGRV